MSDFNIEFEENDQQIKLEFEQAGGGAVKSVNGKTGVVVLDAEDVGAYTKPSGGIPKTDLATAVQTSLGKADTAYQKPSGGIPANDIASGVVPAVDNTLAVSGAAADAKKVGDEISTVKDGLSSVENNILTDDIKQALLQIAEKVAYIDEDGQDYYDALNNALYPTAELVSISAVYTQDGTVYTHDSIDGLKDNLVVTAHYDDDTSAIVTFYTLSGTLTAGTSTITVTYSGKTTTFDVVVTEGVPSTYTIYDYVVLPTVKNNQAKATWLILKTYDNLNAISTEFKTRFIPGHYVGRAILGRRSESGYGKSFAFYAGDNVLGFHLHGVDSAVSPVFTDGVVGTVKYTNTASSPSTLQTTINNVADTKEFTWSASPTLNLAPVLFANPTNDGNINLQHVAEMGWIKFFDLSNNLLSHYFPVVRVSDNRIGMYDIVEQTFYTTSTASYSTIGNSSCYYEVGNWS